MPALRVVNFTVNVAWSSRKTDAGGYEMLKSNRRGNLRQRRSKDRGREEAAPLEKSVIAQIVEQDGGEVFEFTSLAEAFTRSRDMKKSMVPHTVEARSKSGIWVVVDTWVPTE
jgi:hypothetical protein